MWKNNRLSFYYASKELKNDREIVLEAIKQNSLSNSNMAETDYNETYG